MKNLMDAKEIYDKIEVPKELDQVITNLIDDNEKVRNITMDNKRKNPVIFIRYTMVAAAAVIICFSIALNSNEAFAKNVRDIPIIGSLAKVLTVRSYYLSENNKNISVKVPEIVVDDTNNNLDASTDSALNKDIDQKNSKNNKVNTPAIANINSEIDSIVNTYISDARNRMKADKDAFIATGGTEEEWNKRDLNINVDYDVKYQQGDRLSLVLSADESWYGAYDLKYFYNLDLNTNKQLTLEDVLGKDYITVANDSIIRQMKERVAKDSDFVYWGITDDKKSSMEGFTTVDENTKFYLNKDGNPVVYFDKYEIAPGFMGEQEFVIK